jgi:hypothetical protein
MHFLPEASLQCQKAETDLQLEQSTRGNSSGIVFRLNWSAKGTVAEPGF